MTNITVKQLVLLSNNVLAQVTKVDNEGGFYFDCINGAWSGYFDQTEQVIRINETGGKLPAHIVSTTQPPADIGAGMGFQSYNAIIPWMQDHPL